MYKCPHSGRTEFYETEDEWFDKFIWHLKNCTCPIMKLFHFKMIDQDDHIRAYWEMEGKLIVSWDLEFGICLVFRY